MPLSPSLSRMLPIHIFLDNRGWENDPDSPVLRDEDAKLGPLSHQNQFDPSCRLLLIVNIFSYIILKYFILIDNK